MSDIKAIDVATSDATINATDATWYATYNATLDAARNDINLITEDLK